ncbi:hypothetical protein [Brevibacillus reuszeri]|uniref:hypothetical protein n=1 Tax=Brevibacillus reuszeri TaxID=54915 RepID=UPI000CCBEB22|nr:hypothetical protein [Brevibacillus reuszeri]
MHTKAVIRCGSCGYEYSSFGSSPLRDGKSLDCPSCLREMEHQMKSKLIAIMGELDDLNRDFRKYAIEREEPVFQVSIGFVPDKTMVDWR